MVILKSGMYCDLCRKPIFHKPYWNIGITTNVNGEDKKTKGRSCKDCKDKHDKIKWI